MKDINRFLKMEDEYAIGRHPSELSKQDWDDLGHAKRPLLAVIRAKCLDCSHTDAEVRRCVSYGCDLWPYRMRSNPFQAERSEAQKEAALRSAELLRQRRLKASG